MTALVTKKRHEWAAEIGAHDVSPAARQKCRRGQFTLFVHYSEGNADYVDHDFEAIKQIQGIWQFHTGPDRRWDDIGYTWLGKVIDGVLHIWTGRGQGHIPAAQQFHNAGNMAVCILADGDDNLHNKELVAGLSELATRIDAGHIQGHRDVNSTDCPGDAIYRYILPAVRRKTGIPK